MSIEDFRSGARKAHILVVDDDDEVRYMLVESLRDFGYTVVGAASAEEAMPIIASSLSEDAASEDAAPRDVTLDADSGRRASGVETFDMVITDVRMPGMSGLEFADRLQDMRRELKVIVMSGYFQPQPVTRRFLRKPFRMQELASAIADELD